MTLDELLVAWRSRAGDLRPYAPPAAHAFETAALELEQALRAAELEALTLRQASRESGYDEDYLGEMVREGKIPNAGRKHAPRILRRDLPRKPGTGPGAGGVDRASFAAIVREASGTRARR